MPADRLKDFRVRKRFVNGPCGRGIDSALQEQKRHSLDGSQPVAFHRSAAYDKEVCGAAYPKSEVPPEIFLRRFIGTVAALAQLVHDVLCDIVAERQRIQEIGTDDCGIELLGVECDY